MDDCQNLQTAKGIWSSPSIIRAFCECVKEDFLSQKIRPTHCLFVAIVYKIFARTPLLVYILMFITNMAILPLWGLIFQRMFSKQIGILSEFLFIYPLSFFIFTPFWNIFMYPSLQEGPVFFFSTLSIYFFICAFDKKKYGSLLVSIIFSLLCILSKPTGIFITITFVMFSLFDMVVFRRSAKISSLFFVFNISVIFLYYLFMKSALVISGYSSRYIQKLNFVDNLNNIINASFIIKGILIFTVASFCFFLYQVKKDRINIISLLLPLGAISYFIILAPWGMINYLLAPAAPFIMGMFILIYSPVCVIFSRIRLQYLPSIIIVLLSLMVLGQVIIPRISEMADIRKVEESIVDLKNKTVQVRFFFPPPYEESWSAMKKFTRTDIEYLMKGRLSAEMLVEGANYLIYGYACADIILDDVAIKNMVYKNNTWKLFELKKKTGSKKKIHFDFKRTLIQMLIVFLRNKS